MYKKFIVLEKTDYENSEFYSWIFENSKEGFNKAKKTAELEAENFYGNFHWEFNPSWEEYKHSNHICCSYKNDDGVYFDLFIKDAWFADKLEME